MSGEDLTKQQRKILLCGDVRGKLPALYKRFDAVNKKAGPFEAIFCVGAFLPPPNDDPHDDPTAALRPYVEGKERAPIPTYFLDAGGSELPAAVGEGDGKGDASQGGGMGTRVAHNITHLGKPGVAVLHGLRIAVLPGCPFGPNSVLSGSEAGEEKSQDVLTGAETIIGGQAANERLRNTPSSQINVGKPAKKQRTDDGGSQSTPSSADVEAVVTAVEASAGEGGGGGAGRVDLLLTSRWPKNIHDYITTASADVCAASNGGSARVARAARAIQPRYHAAGGCGLFLNRDPYVNAYGLERFLEPSSTRLTRFVALVRLGGYSPSTYVTFVFKYGHNYI